jgi:hypothetical protein
MINLVYKKVQQNDVVTCSEQSNSDLKIRYAEQVGICGIASDLHSKGTQSESWSGHQLS